MIARPSLFFETRRLEEYNEEHQEVDLAGIPRPLSQVFSRPVDRVFAHDPLHEVSTVRSEQILIHNHPCKTP